MLPDFSELKRHLPALTLEHPVDREGVCAEYLHYYRLDLSKRVEGVQQYFGALDLGDYRIACHVLMPREARGTVVVSHGYFDHAGLFDHLLAAVVRDGYAAVIWDLPGHGLSSGEPAAIDSFEEYSQCFRDLLSALSGRLPKPWHAVGQSTGGAIVLRYLFECTEQQETPAFCAAVVLAPLIRAAQWPWVTLQYRLARHWITSVKRVFVRNADNAGFVDFVRTADPLQSRRIPVRWVGAMIDWAARFERYPKVDFPVRVIQGDADGTVNWRYNLKRIRKQFPNARIDSIHGAGHHLVNEARTRRHDVFTKILDELHAREKTS
ncbi:MAG TPA: alpha/beta hydrolase [Pseudomonadales bacterium]|jgi:lysophospholipase